MNVSTIQAHKRSYDGATGTDRTPRHSGLVEGDQPSTTDRAGDPAEEDGGIGLEHQNVATNNRIEGPLEVERPWVALEE
jgi:hypothetical protein